MRVGGLIEMEDRIVACGQLQGSQDRIGCGSDQHDSDWIALVGRRDGNGGHEDGQGWHSAKA